MSRRSVIRRRCCGAASRPVPPRSPIYNVAIFSCKGQFVGLLENETDILEKRNIKTMKDLGRQLVAELSSLPKHPPRANYFRITV